MPASTPVARPEYQKGSGATRTSSKPRRTKAAARLRVNRWACPAPSNTARRAIVGHPRGRLNSWLGATSPGKIDPPGPLREAPMLRGFTTDVAGWVFRAGAVMLWGGWVLRPRRVGMFFQSDDFPAIASRLHLWLWLYRVHLFGVVVSGLALVAMAAVLADRPAVRVLVWPGA